MRPLSALLLVAGLVLEAAAALQLVAPRLSGLGPAWLGLLGHPPAAAIGAAGIYGLLPARYRRPRAGAAAFLLSTALCLPLVGLPGLTIALLPGLYRARERKPADWEARPIPELPYKPVAVATDTVFLRDGLLSVIMHDPDREDRREAVMACRHLSPRRAVPILRAALADPADEVRLLAYSMLSGQEKRLEDELNAALAEAELDRDDDELHESLAQLYWEFSYLGLARGSLQTHVLRQALRFLDIALDIDPEASRWLLRGRICSALRVFDQAATAFDHAEQGGLPPDMVAPYRAEMHFRRADGVRVRAELRRLGPRARRDPVLQPVAAYWSA